MLRKPTSLSLYRILGDLALEQNAKSEFSSAVVICPYCPHLMGVRWCGCSDIYGHQILELLGRIHRNRDKDKKVFETSCLLFFLNFV